MKNKVLKSTSILLALLLLSNTGLIILFNYLSIFANKLIDRVFSPNGFICSDAGCFGSPAIMQHLIYIVLFAFIIIPIISVRLSTYITFKKANLSKEEKLKVILKTLLSSLLIDIILYVLIFIILKGITLSKNTNDFLIIFGFVIIPEIIYLLIKYSNIRKK